MRHTVARRAVARRGARRALLVLQGWLRMVRNGWRRPSWQAHDEGRRALGGARIEAASVGEQDLPGDVEAEPQIAGGRFLVLLRAPERLEQGRQHVGRNRGALVRDSEHDL